MELQVGPERVMAGVTYHSATVLAPGERVTHTLAPERSAWVQQASGAVRLNGTTLAAGDGAAATGEAALEIVAEGATRSELLLFDLA